jgi:hypothetical protein
MWRHLGRGSGLEPCEASRRSGLDDLGRSADFWQEDMQHPLIRALRRRVALAILSAEGAAGALQKEAFHDP